MRNKRQNRGIRFFWAFLLALVQMLLFFSLKTSNLHAQNISIGNKDYGSTYAITADGANNRQMEFTQAGATATVAADAAWGGNILVSTNGTFSITNGSSTTTTLTVNGAISGEGDLIKTGSGTFLLESISTLTGKTMIQAGIFEIGSNGELSSNSAVEISSGAILKLSAASNHQEIASLSGEGKVDFGVNDIDLTLGFDDTDTTFDGTFVGSHGGNQIVKIGTGTFTFNGNGTNFDGTMRVSAGTLSGLANFGNVVVESGATFAPGDRTFDAVDPVFVKELELQAGSTLNMRIDEDGFNDQIITDNLSIIPVGSINFEIDAIAGNYDNPTLKYGEFIVDTSGADLTSHLTSENLSIKQGFLNATWVGNELEIHRNKNFFTSLGLTHNQRAVGQMLDRVTTTGPWNLMTRLSDLNNNPAEVRAAYNEIASDLRANSLMLGQWRTSRYGLNHLDLTRCGESQENSVWVEVIHQTTNFDSDGNSSDYGISRTGFIIGSEEKREETTFGMLVGYSRPHIYNHGNKVKTGDFQVGFYGGARIQDFLEMKLYIGYGHQSYELKRYIHNPLLIDPNSQSNLIKGEGSGDSMPMSLEFAMPFQGGMCSFRPVLAIDSDLTWQYGMTEYGDTGLELSYSRAFYDRTFLRLGCTAQLGSVDKCTTFALLGRFYYGHQIFGDSTPSARARFLTEPESNTMKIYGVDTKKSEFDLGLGLRWNVDDNCAFYGDYDLLLTDRSTGHYGSLGYVQKW